MSEIQQLYKDREDFCVTALTGYTSSGCSRMADLMADKEFWMHPTIRRASTIGLYYPHSVNNEDIFFGSDNTTVNSAISLLNFKRKFEICQNFIQQNYQPFIIIHYSSVLLLMALLELAEANENAADFKRSWTALLHDKYHPSVTDNDKEYIKSVKERHNNTLPWDSNLPDDRWNDWESLFRELKSINQSVGDERNRKLAKAMGLVEGFDSAYAGFQKKFNDWLFQTDYYCACFFYHRLGYQIRKSGKASPAFNDVYGVPDDFTKIYCVVKTINKIIKGLRNVIDDQGNYIKTPCRIVIDSIRNSLEARYLKERYSAFYLIAVHDALNARRHLEKKITEYLFEDAAEAIQNRDILQMQIEKVWHLGKTEQSNSDFEKGKFASPNTEQCVADAEIHISNSTETRGDAPYFQSMAEQWLKYASLILHPGLITPSSEERCMVVAYTAKFNSGCLSRQVGAVITNSAHSIRSIGWNDVPYGQTPCSLRSLFDIPSLGNNFGGHANEKCDTDYIFSRFEHGDLIPTKYKGVAFNEKTLCKYRYLRRPEKFTERLKGLPLTYCFKSLHNEYEDVKNQVHTRALHAEENAILQMARFGGMPLENGIIYVTASPCELCCKKLYQIGIRKIIYIDEYPGISRENIISIGFKRPNLKQFQGAFGATYFKLYQPVMPYKEELKLRLEGMYPKPEDTAPDPQVSLKQLLKSLNIDTDPAALSAEQINTITDYINSLKGRD